MKRIITYIMVSTGLSLVILAVIINILIPNDDIFFSRTVLPVFAANIVVNLGLIVTRRFESKHIALEVLLDIVYTSTVLIVFGLIFDWVTIVPIWILVAMATVIHLIILVLNIARIREDTNKINKLLKKRDKDKTDKRH